MRKLLFLAQLLKLLLFLLLDQIQQRNPRNKTTTRHMLPLTLIRREDGQMLSNHRVGLLPPGSFMRNGVQGSLDAVNCCAAFFGMIDTNPSKADCLQFLLKLGVHDEFISILVVDEGDPEFGAVVVFPEVLA